MGGLSVRSRFASSATPSEDRQRAIQAKLKARRKQRILHNSSRTEPRNHLRLLLGSMGCGLVLVWIMGMCHFSGSDAPADVSLLNGLNKPNLRAARNPDATIRASTTEVIDMRELAYTLPFDNPDGGAWKQGWDVQPVSIDKRRPIRIFVVPHSHCDPGWIKTFDDYFQSQTKQILTSVVDALAKDPNRKFIWAEISYFEWWWREQPSKTRDLVRRLIKNKQFEFVTAGWVQPDEANTQLYAMEVQLQEGHDFLRSTFPEQENSAIPKYGWSIDPFGYSPTMAYLLKKYGFKAMLIQRVHYAVKKELAKRKHLEFFWRQTWDKTGEYDIFTHLMPFYSYDAPHSCGPDPAICCQFDFARMREVKRNAGCPWHINPQVIEEYNVAERARLLLDQYLKKASLYRGNTVLAPLGDDFRYETSVEAEAQFTNYEKLFEYINKNIDGVSIQFGTLSDYFGTTMKRFAEDPKPLPVLKGSFFTYSDREQDYWSGYFTSRVFDKALDRKLERSLYAATAMGANRFEMQGPRRALSLFQHHDGVTGTAKNYVVEDYAKRIHTAIGDAQAYMTKMIQAQYDNESMEACWRSDVPRGLSHNLCNTEADIVLFNPLMTNQTCGSVVVTGRSHAIARLPCETPGSLPASKSGIQFDSQTGLMTHPIKEQWMVWKVRQGGAYLFFPGKLDKYDDNREAVIEGGGYVVKTTHWTRTVVEKVVPTEFGTTAIVIDFVYVTALKNSNEEWFVRFSGDIANAGTFNTDLNGFNFDTHRFRKDMPIQSQVFPMPTLASVEDANQRMTVLSEHAQGTASLEDGSIDVWLDRRLTTDDNRGLGQGVMDNVPTRTRLRILLEKDGYDHGAAEYKVTPLGQRMWDELNHPLEMFGEVEATKAIDEDFGGGEFKTDKETAALRDKTYVPFVYMVYKRVEYLKEALDSLKFSDFPRERVPIVISHDGRIPEVVNFVASVKKQFKVIEIFHPYACYDHPNEFPGNDTSLNVGFKGDSYGNPREFSVTCCKHHFTWLLNEAFKLEELSGADQIMFMEEDYIVAPTVYSTIAAGLSLISSKVESEYFGLTMIPSDFPHGKAPSSIKTGWIQKRFVSGPMVLSRAMYGRIKQNAKEYCTFDEYNWDWSFVHLMGRSLLPFHVIAPSKAQVGHIGIVGGMHEATLSKAAKKARETLDLQPFTPHGDTNIATYFDKKTQHEKGYGGWGHPADHGHCLKLFGVAPDSTMSKLAHIFGLGS